MAKEGSTSTLLLLSVGELWVESAGEGVVVANLVYLQMLFLPAGF
jgi:hypothetical protein